MKMRRRRESSGEGVVAEVQIAKVVEGSKVRDGARHIVELKMEPLQAGEGAEGTRDGALKAVAVEVELLEVGEGGNGGGDVADIPPARPTLLMSPPRDWRRERGDEGG